ASWVSFFLALTGAESRGNPARAGMSRRTVVRRRPAAVSGVVPVRRRPIMLPSLSAQLTAPSRNEHSHRARCTWHCVLVLVSGTLVTTTYTRAPFPQWHT